MADEVTVEFDAAIQSVEALNGAAYRLIGTATCQIDKQEGRLICRLTLRSVRPNEKPLDPESVRLRFLELVSDETVRERMAARTEPVRNLILALAFGSLASSPNDKS